MEHLTVRFNGDKNTRRGRRPGISERPGNLGPESNIRQSKRLRTLGGANNPREEKEAGNFPSLFEEEYAVTERREDEEIEDNVAPPAPPALPGTLPTAALNLEFTAEGGGYDIEGPRQGIPNFPGPLETWTTPACITDTVIEQPALREILIPPNRGWRSNGQFVHYKGCCEWEDHFMGKRDKVCDYRLAKQCDVFWPLQFSRLRSLSSGAECGS